MYFGTNETMPDKGTEKKEQKQEEIAAAKNSPKKLSKINVTISITICYVFDKVSRHTFMRTPIRNQTKLSRRDYVLTFDFKSSITVD